MAEQWIKYVQNFDILFEQAILVSVRNSLKCLYEILHGDGTTGPNPVIKLNITLKNNKINFEPSISSIAYVIADTLSNITEAFQDLPRLLDKFHITETNIMPFSYVIENDPECVKIHFNLNEG